MTQEEILELNSFVKRYREIQVSIDTMQSTIESLARRRDLLFDEIDQMKTKEEGFMNSLIEKYGASEITPNKLIKWIDDGNS
jgi:cell division protein FtsB